MACSSHSHVVSIVEVWQDSLHRKEGLDGMKGSHIVDSRGKSSRRNRRSSQSRTTYYQHYTIIHKTSWMAMTWKMHFQVYYHASCLRAVPGFPWTAEVVLTIGICIIATSVQRTYSATSVWHAWPQDDLTLSRAFVAVSDITFAYAFASSQPSFVDEVHTPQDDTMSISALCEHYGRMGKFFSGCYAHYHPGLGCCRDIPFFSEPLSICGCPLVSGFSFYVPPVMCFFLLRETELKSTILETQFSVWLCSLSAFVFLDAGFTQASRKLWVLS